MSAHRAAGAAYGVGDVAAGSRGALTVAGRVAVSVGGRTLQVSNLDKVLYPAADFRKRDVIDYYQRIASVMLPHLRGRAATLVRFPDGVDHESFFQKDVGRYAPEWLRTARLASGARGRGTEVNDHAVFEESAGLVWAANLAALELHVPQWTVESNGERGTPDLLVLDLDPGQPATIVDCARLARLIRELLLADGLLPVVKTSGSKGMQLYCAVRTTTVEATSDYAKRLAQRVAAERPEQVVAKMDRALRRGKVLIDWSQNNPAKTTIAPYSLRAREVPSVSTPVSWDEIEACRHPDDLAFTARSVLERVDNLGDVFAGLCEGPHPRLP